MVSSGRTLLSISIVIALTWILASNFTAFFTVPESHDDESRSIQTAWNHLEQSLAKANREIDSLKQELLDSRRTENKKETVPALVHPERADSRLFMTHLATKKVSSMCSHLPQPIPSTLAVWMAHLETIVNASQHENDATFKLHDFTTELLHLVSQHGRIQKSIVGLPNNYATVKKVMELVYSRYKYLKHGGPFQQKVKILVMGGSLVVGVNCRKIVVEHNLGFPMPNRLCTWTHRLETFLNKVWGADIFQVDKVAMGGTNTATGFVLWDNDFLPLEQKHPDILINAYSTNDMHILTVMEAKESNTSLRDKVMEMTQDFVRSVIKDGACAPLLLHVDDYLGNEQREILATMHLSQAVQSLAAYYGFAAISYANVVRDLVYGDTKEQWFSPNGWYEGETMVREIHPGMGMHIASSWVVAYALLNLALTFCTIEEWETQSEQTVQPLIPGLPKLRNTPIITGKPKPVPRGLLPPLTEQLNLDEVSALWQASEVPSDDCSFTDAEIVKCPFSWISGVSSAGRNVTYAKEIFEAYSVNGSTWLVDESGGKIGISPPPNSTAMVLEFPKLRQPIHSITIFYMKSYGEKWTNSEIALSAQVTEGSNWKEIQRIALYGFHQKQTSETYTHRLKLDLDVGVDFRVEIKSTGGKTFKIMGLAICK